MEEFKGKLMAVIDQKGVGCDYTVHCGTKVEIQKDDEDVNIFINRIVEDYTYDEVSVRYFKIKQVNPKPEKVLKWVLGV